MRGWPAVRKDRGPGEPGEPGARLHGAAGWPVLAVILAGALTAGCTLLSPVWGGNGLPGAAPACPWPLRVRGHPTAAEAGLVRCYLRAVARHDLAALRPLVNPAYRVTAAQLAQTAGARAGLATATFATSPIDTGVATVRIDFADGATGSVGIEIVNPQAAGSWRLDIGTAPGPAGPAPAGTPGG